MSQFFFTLGSAFQLIGPNIALDSEGELLVTGISDYSETYSGYRLIAGRYDITGTALGNSIFVDPTDGEPFLSIRSKVAVDNDGDGVIIWEDSGSGGYSAQWIDKTGALVGTARTIEGGGDAGVDAQGNTVIVRQQLNTSTTRYDIFAQRFSGTGTPLGNEFQVSPVGDLGGDPHVAVAPDGSFVVEWVKVLDRYTGVCEIRARRYNSAGSPLGDDFVVSNSGPGQGVTGKIAIADNGVFAIAWTIRSGSSTSDANYKIAIQRYSSTGTELGSPLVLTSGQTFTKIYDMDMDADGDLVISIKEDRGSYIYYYNNQGALVESFEAAAYDLEMDAYGNFVAVQSDTMGHFVGQRYAAQNTVQFSQANYQVRENNSAVGVPITLTRTNPSIGTSVQIRINEFDSIETATPGVDYTRDIPITVTFAPGQSTVTAVLPILQDQVIESTESLAIYIDTVTGGSKGIATIARVDILDDDSTITFTGGNGNDSLVGNGLNNQIFGNGGNDRLSGGAGNDTLAGGTGSDILAGDQGNDRLVGGLGNDTLVGGAGNDTLLGDQGNDRLTGNSGADQFVFDIGSQFNRSSIGLDTITDFSRGVDKIVLDRTTFTKLSRLSFASVSNATAAANSTALITYVRSSGALFYNENGRSAGFGTGGQFADLTNGLILAATDISVKA